jgi:hypothetical protein
VHLHEAENPLLVVVNHAVLHRMEAVGLREVAHNTWNMTQHVQCWANMAQQEFGIGYLRVSIMERSILVLIPLGVLLVRREMLSLFVPWTLAPKTVMSLAMM